MRTRLTCGALAAALALVASTTYHPAHAQRRAARASRNSARTCVQFTRAESEDGRTIEFQLHNQCTVPIEGRVAWSIGCGNDPATPEERLESLEPGTRRVVVASAESCGTRAYRIEGVHWSWRPEQ